VKRRETRAGHDGPKDISLKHVKCASDNIFFSSAEVANLPHATTGWVGLHSKPGSLPPKTAEMEDLDKRGFKEIQWNGLYILFSSFPPSHPHHFLVPLAISLTKTTKPPRFWQDGQLPLVGINFLKTSHISWRTPGKIPKSILVHALEFIVGVNSRPLRLVFLLGVVKPFVPRSFRSSTIPTPLRRNQGTSKPIQTNVWSRGSSKIKTSKTVLALPPGHFNFIMKRRIRFTRTPSISPVGNEAFNPTFRIRRGPPPRLTSATMLLPFRI